jgi:hypothetical protein
MIPIEQTAEALFDKIRNRFQSIQLGNDQGKDSNDDPKQARFFNFDFIHEDQKFGNITVSLLGDFIKVFYSEGMIQSLTDENKRIWFDWIKSIRKFAHAHLKTFDVRDIGTSGLKATDLAFIARDSGTGNKDTVDINESKLFGTSRTSYQQLENVRIIARHNRPVDDDRPGSRSRNIETFFVENGQGERFRLPEGTSLNGARAYARHVKNGGTIYDDFGNHIGKMIAEMNSLRLFVRNMRGRTFEDSDTSSMVESAVDHYGKLHTDLFLIRSQRGYEAYKNLWQPELMDEEQIDIDSLKERFVKKVFDERLTTALPIVFRAHKTRQSKESLEFEDWANNLIAETERNTVDTDNMKLAAQDLDLEETSGDNGSDSPFTKLYDIEHDSDGNVMDGDDTGISELLNRNGFEFRFSDGVYYFESKQELERAKDIIAQNAVHDHESVKYPKMKVYDYEYGIYGASGFDRTLPGHGVKESLDILDIKKLSGLCP